LALAELRDAAGNHLCSQLSRFWRHDELAGLISASAPCRRELFVGPISIKCNRVEILKIRNRPRSTVSDAHDVIAKKRYVVLDVPQEDL
jgi:hypothetical protein